MAKLPIRQLVELMLRSGDIDSRFASGDRMHEGARAHRVRQKTNRERYDDYRSEVFLAGRYCCQGEEYVLEGRADGVFSLDGAYIVEEIKTTARPISSLGEELDAAHWGQAKCYAHIFGRQHDLAEVSIQLTYINLDTNESKSIVNTFALAQLEEFVNQLLAQYAEWANFTLEWLKIRDASIKSLQFPFSAYRHGQRQLAVAAFRTIAGRTRLFVQAPTGVGKTISVLFPAIKAMGEGMTAKIFYLTARTTTRLVAEEAVARMRAGGLRIKTLTLTAKDKICFCEQTACRPDYCQYAQGHYDRVNQAILDAIQASDDLSRPVIEDYARRHRVCPFELSLDLALLADCVICDYNYVFDPRAYLRRFFTAGGGEHVFLIDEAHNLVDRAREMFSAQLDKSRFLKVKKGYKGRSRPLDKIMNSINRHMIGLRQQCLEKGGLVVPARPDEFIDLVGRFVSWAESMLKDNRDMGEDQDFLRLYFDALSFMSIADLYDERYVTMVEADRHEVVVKLFCLDPSHLLAESLERGIAAIMFSATLTPLPYFRDILGGGEGDGLLALGSPFDPDNLCLLVADRVSTRYRDRERSREEVAGLIGSFVSVKTGNYMVYFPSYRYMRDVYQVFAGLFPDLDTVLQGSGMGETDREAFLAGFAEEPARTRVGFCVLGGIFSEGIDLAGSRLIGAVVVSVGLPQLSVQQDTIMDYFQSRNGRGYEYAYQYPGMNKVLQAAGRVIRTESDRGAVLLIDERYGHRSYRELFPRHWHKHRKVNSPQAIHTALVSFWSKPAEE
ncbi:MAG: ATP-dependent DNA helicase [Syntrophomonadaceae bacterium]